MRVRANLRPSQRKLDRLENAAIHASDEEIDAATRWLERRNARRDRRFWSFYDNLVLKLRRGSWGVSLNLGLVSLHRHMRD